MRMKFSSATLMLIAVLIAGCGGDDSVESLNPAPPATPVSPFKQVVVFGDSLSDAGTYNPTTADADPANDSATGLIFSTKPGTTWAGYVATNLGLTLAPNQQVNFGIVGNGGEVIELGGLDYAEGGARILVDAPDNGVVTQNVPGIGNVPVQTATARSIATQITDYLAEHDSFDATQLVLIQGGANDFFGFLRAVAGDPSLAANAPTVISDNATAMVTQISRLKAAGAAHVLYANLPDLGKTPQFHGTPLEGLATTLAQNYNAAVASALSAQAVPIFDTYALIAEVVAAPQSFGFSDVTTPACTSETTPGDPTTLSALICSPATLVSANADITHLFADGVHPTVRAHALWADQVTAELSQTKGGVVGAYLSMQL